MAKPNFEVKDTKRDYKQGTLKGQRYCKRQLKMNEDPFWL